MVPALVISIASCSRKHWVLIEIEPEKTSKELNGPAMLVIGILGGVASGKSLVTEQLKKLGAEVLDADRVGHEVLREVEVKNKIRTRWGASVFNPQGEVNRSEMARIVFAPPPAGPIELAELEKITHPRIGLRLQEFIQEGGQSGEQRLNENRVLVLDAPVLLKAGWDKFCNRILFVEATREQRVARAAQRGWTEAQLAAREAAQEPLDEKRHRADWTIDNSGTPEATWDQVQRFWHTLHESFPTTAR